MKFQEKQQSIIYKEKPFSSNIHMHTQKIHSSNYSNADAHLIQLGRIIQQLGPQKANVHHQFLSTTEA